jgi:calcium-translocating P-type ATPase
MKNLESTTWHQLSGADACRQLEVDRATGLTPADVQSRLEQFGPNELREKPGTPAWVMFLHQFKSPLIYVLLAAAIIAAFLGEFKDAGVIFGVLMINAIIGFVQEGRAERSMAALKKLSAPQTHVRRDGHVQTIPSRDLVPGDVLIISAGDKIAADARLTDAAALIALEGALTGESTGVNKKLEALPAETPLADRKNMVFAGTVIASGRGEAVVVATGMQTELGKIATMVQEAGETLTPLQVRMKKFSQLIIIVVLSVMTLVFALGVWRGLPLRDIFMVALSQAVSAIPEGLPVAVTVALAVGMQRMAKRRAIIRKLAAVETLGSATVICTDKTGTLTKNEMSVTRVILPGRKLSVTGIGYDPQGEFQEDSQPVSVEAGTDLRALLECGALCNDSTLDDGKITGDPTEGALVVAAEKAGIQTDEFRRQHQRAWEIPFDAKYRMMATGHGAGNLRVCVKGAPEEVMGLCTTARRDGKPVAFTEADREAIREAQRELSADGLRVLAFAEAELPQADLGDTYDCLRGKLTFLGLMAQIDPPRPEVREAVALCKQAGVRTVMVTGDHMLTGKSIARDLGIADEHSTALEGADVPKMSAEEFDKALDTVAVFGRVAPEHKLRIVEGLQRKGHVAAMTGDGVNDAPALAKADIGVAMGITGTEVAKEASAMVITDDNFATIVSAIEQGRIIFNNIRKAVYYLFSTSAAEILALMTALIAGLSLPLRAVQILWVNLVTDGALTVNLVMEKAEGDEMNRPPLKRGASLVPKPMLHRMFLLVPVMGLGTIALFWWAKDSGRSYEHAQTMAFTVICAFQWFNGLNARSYKKSIFQLGLFSNLFVLGGLTVAVGLQVLVVHWEALGRLFHTVPLTLAEWGIIVAVASTVLWVDELRKLWVRYKHGGED